MASRRFPVLLAVLALSVVPAACGDDDDSSSGGGGGGSSESAEAASVTFKPTETANGRVTIDGPKTIEAGVVEITLDNSANKGPHDAQILRVEGDHTAKETMAATVASGEGAPIPDWVVDGAGVGTVKPGQTGTVTQVLEPGKYYLFDTESGQGGRQNAQRGGIAEFEVTGEGGGELPDTEATITAEDYSFTAEGIEAGSNRVRFANEGQELHHLIAMPLAKGATFAEAKKAFTADEEPQGPPPVDFESGVGTAVIDGGQEQVVELDFKKGKYALVCFISDRKGGPPHAAMGMISELDVE